MSYLVGSLLRFGGYSDQEFESEGGRVDARGNKRCDMVSTREYSSDPVELNYLNNVTDITWNVADTEWYKREVPIGYELQVAHLAARLPLLAIIGAEKQLPRVQLESGASEKPLIRTTLQVKWERAIAVLGAILVGQLLAVVVVFCWCRNVFVRQLLLGGEAVEICDGQH
ncbi:hypothetical protein OQA88_3758 [Cercophora sp. LCS_1]